MCRRKRSPLDLSGDDIRPGDIMKRNPAKEIEVFAPDALLQLERFAYTPHGTFGRLRMPEFECYTVERPWFNNVPRESCIPIGTYPLCHSRYNRGGYDTLLIDSVPGRSLIKIHRGNTMDDVLGCVAIGNRLGYITGRDRWAVLNSIDVFQEWWELLKNFLETYRGIAIEDLDEHIHIFNTPPGGKLGNA